MPPERPRALLDLHRSDDAHTAQRLTDAPVIWLGTTRPDGRPHQIPVWFAWEDPEILIFSQPGAQKLRNIASSPQVTLHLDTAQAGQDLVIVEGTAAAAETHHVAHLVEAFEAKYSPTLGPAGIQAWRNTFAQPVLVTTTRVVAWTRKGGDLAYRSVP